MHKICNGKCIKKRCQLHESAVGMKKKLSGGKSRISGNIRKHLSVNDIALTGFSNAPQRVAKEPFMRSDIASFAVRNSP